MDGTATAIDGRRARSERHRDAVSRALLDLIRMTGREPTADEIAERAEVSRRSVFRLFEDRGALLRAASDLMIAEISERFPFPDLGSFPGDEQLPRLVAHFAAVYEYVTPLRRVMERVRKQDDALSAEQVRAESLYRDEIRSVLRPLLFRHIAINSPEARAVRLMLSWQAWEQLRTGQRLSVKESVAAVVAGLSAIRGIGR